MNDENRTYFDVMRLGYTVLVSLMIILCQPNLLQNVAVAQEEGVGYLGFNYGYMNTSEWFEKGTYASLNDIMDLQTGHTLGGIGLYLKPMGDTGFAYGGSLTYTYVKIPIKSFRGEQYDIPFYLQETIDDIDESYFTFDSIGIGGLIGLISDSPWVTFAGLEYHVRNRFIPTYLPSYPEVRDFYEQYLTANTKGFGLIGGIMYGGDDGLSIGVVGKTFFLFESTSPVGTSAWSLLGTCGFTFR